MFGEIGEYVRTSNRFELKYVLHHAQVRELLSTMAPHVHFDPHAGPDGCYKVATLYYDSPDLRCYWEKLDGEKFRRKLRIRTYGERPETAFVEIKQRYNLSVQKKRAETPIELVHETMDRMLHGGYSGGSDPVFDEVAYLARTQRLGPRLLVSYNRAAYFDRYKKDLRVTVDRNLRCRDVSLDLRDHRMRGHFVLPPTMMIVEVKFNDTMPRWLCQALNRFDARIERISKYCSAVESRGLQRGLAGRRERRGGPLALMA